MCPVSSVVSFEHEVEFGTVRARPARRANRSRTTRLRDRLALHPAGARVEMELACIACARSAIRSRRAAPDVVFLAHFEQHLRPGVDRRVDALQEFVEERLQARDARRLVVIRPLLAAVNFQPLVLGRDPLESFERPALVQALIGPRRDDEGRRDDLREVRDFRRPERRRTADDPGSPARCPRSGACSRPRRSPRHFVQNDVSGMPPWRATSRYVSLHPSQMFIAARCGGCSAAVFHWLCDR